MARRQLQNLTEPMYYILLSLLEPMHGYAIMQNINNITDGMVKVGPGTLYSLISRFEKENIVKKIAVKESRKTYILTDKGREVLLKEFKRLKRLVKDGSILLKGENNEEY